MNPKSKRFAQFLCAGAFFVIVAVLVTAGPIGPAAPTITTHTKMRVITTGDPAVDAQQMANFRAAIQAGQKKIDDSIAAELDAKMNKWHGTNMGLNNAVSDT